MALPVCFAELLTNFVADVGFSKDSISLKKNRAHIRMHCRPKNPRAKT